MNDHRPKDTKSRHTDGICAVHGRPAGSCCDRPGYAVPETGWVLVKYIGQARTIHYLIVADCGWWTWSPDHTKALRLSRRADGDALARIIEDADAVEEHSWG